MGATRTRRKFSDAGWSERAGRRVRQMVREYLDKTRAELSEDDVEAEEFVHPAYRLALSNDPWPDLLSEWSDCRQAPEWRRRIFMGADDDGLIFAQPDQNVLALGPPRSNKTAGTLIDALLTWSGPAVSTSNKPDVLIATAVTRARLGPVWHFCPDGRPHAPGAIPLRWSPLQASRAWAGAQEQAEVMIGAVESKADKVGGRDNIWSRQAASFLAPILHAAAIAGKPMNWVVDAVVGQDFDRLKESAQILDDAGEEAHLALQALNSVMRAHPEGQKSVILTAASALKVYTHPGALAQTEDPNFDPAVFVAGEPEAVNEDRYSESDRRLSVHANVESIAEGLPKGRYGTVYVTSGSPLVKPVVAALLKAITSAAFAQHETDEINRYRNRVKVLWAADEVALTPLPDLPEMLGYCASRGVMVVACTQDLSQIEATWGREHADGFLSLFQEIVVFPGIRNPRTLEAVSTVLGKRWVTLSTHSHGLSVGGERNNRSWNDGETHHLVPVLDPGEIASGHPDNPDLALAIRPHLWGWLHPLPYFRSSPWPELLVADMCHLHHRIPDGDPRQWLPIPDLDRAGDGRFLRRKAHKPNLLRTYRRERNWFDARRATPSPANAPAPEPRPAVLELSFSAGDSEEDINRTIQAAFGAWTTATALEQRADIRDDQQSASSTEGE